MCLDKYRRKGKVEQFLAEFSIAKDKNEVAFLIGNGFNRYACRNGAKSWDELIERLEISCSFDRSGYNLLDTTEQYSAIVLAKGEEEVMTRLVDINQKDLECTDRVKELNVALRKINIPVLTTNIDDLIDCDPTSGKAYPTYDFVYDGGKIDNPREILHDSLWTLNNYFAPQELKSADSGYGVWHIHGHSSHQDTIRFGLVSYAKLIARLSRRLDTISDDNWLLKNTWMNLLMKKRLCIVGLNISRVEFSLRYFLLRRCHIFKEIFGCPSPGGWYLYTKKEESDLEPVLQFVKSVGIVPVSFDDYDPIYNTIIKISKDCK